MTEKTFFFSSKDDLKVLNIFSEFCALSFFSHRLNSWHLMWHDLWSKFKCIYLFVWLWQAVSEKDKLREKKNQCAGLHSEICSFLFSLFVCIARVIVPNITQSKKTTSFDLLPWNSFTILIKWFSHLNHAHTKIGNEIVGQLIAAFSCIWLVVCFFI